MDLLKQDDSEEPVNNYTASPAVDTDSDEDSGDEDDGGLINNLNANQLRATAETVLPNGRLGEKETADLSNPSQTSRVPPKRRKTTQKSSLSYKWSKKVKTQLKPNDIMDSHPVTLDFSGKSPLVIFEFFFDDETLNFIVEESKRYACQKRIKFTVSLQDMKTFFGILCFLATTSYKAAVCIGPCMKIIELHQSLRQCQEIDSRIYSVFCTSIIISVWILQTR